MDVRSLSEEHQYMKRSYHQLTEQGDREIADRISMLAGSFCLYFEDFYSNANILKYEYPMMIITDTQTIFKKRGKRLKKIYAEEGSSDDTQSQPSFYYNSFPSQNFLKGLSTISFDYVAQKNHHIDYSFDYSIHDIYDQLNAFKQQFRQSESQLAIQIKRIRLGQNLNHLIVSFNDQNSNSEKDSKKDCLYIKRESLKNILNTEVQRQKYNQFYQRQRSQQNFANKTKKNFVGSFLKMFQNGRHRRHAFDFDFANSDPIEQTNIQELNNKLTTLQRVDQYLQKQKEERMANRRKIREKAEELLKKVRNQEKTIKTYDIED